jgi:hypothetical protein
MEGVTAPIDRMTGENIMTTETRTCAERPEIFLLSRDSRHSAFACRLHYPAMISRMNIAGGSPVSAYRRSTQGAWCEYHDQMAGAN